MKGITMKKSIRVIVMVIVMLSVLLAGCGKAKEGALVIKIAHASPEDSASQIVCETFAKELENRLGSKVDVRIFSNATLGSEAEMVEAIKMGTLEACTFGRHSAIDSRLDVINLPFLFENDAQISKALRGEEGNDFRSIVNSIMLENGTVALGWYETGFREITSNKPIEKVEDLKGLLIRTPSTETLKKSFTVWGASPTAVDLSELYTSLQSGVVEAQENPYQLIESNKLYEVQNYLCVTNHLTIPNQLVFSKKIMEEYPDDVKKAIEEAGRIACDAGAEYNIKMNATLLSELSEKMEVTCMDDASIMKMKEMAYESVWPDFVKDDLTRNIVESIQNIK